MKDICSPSYVHFLSTFKISYNPFPENIFSYLDVKGVLPREDDPKVISLQIFVWDIKRVLIDLGSSDNVLYVDDFEIL